MVLELTADVEWTHGSQLNTKKKIKKLITRIDFSSVFNIIRRSELLKKIIIEEV